MTKEQYLIELEQCLVMVPPSEKKEALRYVEEYFDEAGVDQAELVCEELGTPDEYAKRLKSEIPQIPPIPHEEPEEEGTVGFGAGWSSPNFGSYTDTDFYQTHSTNRSYGNGEARAQTIKPRQASNVGRIGRIVLMVLGIPFFCVLIAMTAVLSLMVVLALLMLSIAMVMFLIVPVIAVPVYVVRMFTLFLSEPFQALFLGGICLCLIGLWMIDLAAVRVLIKKGLRAVIHWLAAAWRQLFDSVHQLFYQQ